MSVMQNLADMIGGIVYDGDKISTSDGFIFCGITGRVYYTDCLSDETHSLGTMSGLSHVVSKYNQIVGKN